MEWRTHLMTGLAAGYLVAGPDANALLAAGITALLPDIDHPKSYIGSKIPLLPSLIKITMGHRGPLHSLAAAIFTSLVVAVVGGPFLGVAAGLGYVAHILGDLLTPSGVPLLWPLYKKDIKLPVAKTGGLLERFIIFPGVCVGLMVLIF